MAELGEATVNRILHQKSCSEGEYLKELLNSRNNEEIVNHLKDSNRPREDFQLAVLQLTCNNDPETLEKVLSWGAEEGRIAIRWDQVEDENGSRPDKRSVKKKVINEENPILWSAQQGYTQCTKLLHQHGFRIPQIRGGAVLEGEKEAVRQKEVMKDPGDDDHVAKYLTFDAYASPHYLSLGFTEDPRIDNPDIRPEDLQDLDRLDPLRRAFQLAEKAEEFQSDSSELAKNFAGIKNSLEQFTRGVLTQCSDMDEISTILSHKPDATDEDDKPLQQNAFITSLMEGREEFVSHPFFQQYLLKKMIGDSTSKKSKSARAMLPKVLQPLWYLVYWPYVLLISFFYPIIIFLDLFRNADILFVSRNDLKKKRGNDYQENWIFSHFRSRMHTPFFRIIVYAAIQLLYLALLVVLVWDPVKVDTDTKCTSDETKADISPLESAVSEETTTEAPKSCGLRYALHQYTYFILVLTGILLAEGWLKFFTKDLKYTGKHDFFETFWTPFNLSTRSLLFLGGVMVVAYHENNDRANLSGNHPVNIGHTLMSIGIGAEVLMKLRFLIQFERFGTLVICIISVLREVIKILPIYFLLFGGFGLSMWSMVRPFQSPEAQNGSTQYYMQEPNSRNDRSFFHVLFWRNIYADGPDKMFVVKNYTWNGADEDGGPEKDFSMEFSHLMPMAFWGIYQVIVVILMLNLLIAIMNNNFNSVWATSDMEWKYSKSVYQAQFLPSRAAVPSPFTWVYYIARAVYRSKGGSLEPAKEVEEKKKYFRLLKKLILIKERKEHEQTADDKMEDLRRDLRNDLLEWTKGNDGLRRTKSLKIA